MDSDGFHILVRKAQDGDRGAMDRVLVALRPRLEKMARGYADPIRPAQSTSDLLQESCLRAWQKLGTFQGGQGDEETFAKFQAWIGRIVRNLGLNQQREGGAMRRSPPEEVLSLDRPRPGASGTSAAGIDAPARGPSPSSHAHMDDMARRVRAALAELNDQTDAVIVRMHFFDEMSFPQIAKRLALRYDQVRERYRSTMRSLERELKKWQ